MKLKDLSLKELAELKNDLAQELENREKAKKEIQEILDKYGLELLDVMEKPAAKKKTKKKAAKKKATRKKASRKKATRKKTTRKRGKKAAKKSAPYQNPENPSETWAGRGRKPNWLEEKLAAGAKLEDFEVGGGGGPATPAPEPTAAKKKAGTKKKKAVRKKKSSLKGRKIPPKYRNPDTARETWTGRGRKPKWVEAKLASGVSLDSMLIK